MRQRQQVPPAHMNAIHPRERHRSLRSTCLLYTSYTGVFCAVSLIIDRAARHGAQQTGFLAVGGLETMLLAASLTVLLRLPAPERPEKEEPAPAATATLISSLVSNKEAFSTEIPFGVFTIKRSLYG